MKFILSGCLFFLLACNGSTSNTTSTTSGTAAIIASVTVPDTTTLAGGWWLQPVLASDIASGQVPILCFNLAKTHFYGNTGCNTMNGTFWYSDRDSSLSFSDKFVTTRMHCQGYNEGAFVKSLINANHYRLEKGTLILMTDNTELSRWTRKVHSVPGPAKA
jgi:heat shock protein HslJ